MAESAAKENQHSSKEEERGSRAREMGGNYVVSGNSTNSNSKFQNARERIKSQMDYWKKLLETMKTSTKTSLRYFVEDPSIMIIFLLISYFDILLGSLQLHGTKSLLNMPIESLREISLFVQTFELLLQLVMFRSRFFSHWGYLVECGLVAGRFLQLNEKDLHLLSFLRIWRFVQVVDKYVAIECKSTEKWKRKATKNEEVIEREKQLSKQNQDMVEQCQQEISTLREALKIAALDVAAAMRGQIDSKKDMDGTDIDVVEHDSEGDDLGDVMNQATNPLPKEALVEESSTDGLVLE